MKKLRLFDSLKFVRAMFVAVACVFILNIAHADIPTGYTQITSSDTTNYPNTLTGYTKYTITNASGEYIGGISGGEAYIRYQIGPENIVGDGAQISNMFKRAGIDSSNEVIGFIFFYSTSNKKTFVSVRDSSKFTTVASARTYFTAHPLIILVKTTTPTDNVYQLVKRTSDNVIGYYCTSGTNVGDFVPAYGAEDDSTIKIATTRYNEKSFAPVETRLDAAVAAVEYVVSNTMTQAQQIDQIATTKQTRPDEGCTAKYCLLVEDEDGTPHWYPIAGANGVAHALPAGYTELQYIESTGTQYIDTGIYANNTIEVETKFKLPAKDSQTRILFCGRDGVQNAAIDLRRYKEGDRVIISASFGATAIQVSSNDTDAHTYSIHSNEWKLDNMSIGSLPTAAFRSDYTIWLFACNQPSPQFRYATIIYHMKIWDDNSLVRNFIPAKNSDNVVGMYDLVSGRFFTTPDGTGTFTAGPEM